MEEKEAEKRKIRLKRLLCVLAAALFVVASALCGCFLPFERLQPAQKIVARAEGELRIHFLDVGQGDCTIVEFPSGNILVVDAGDGSFSARNKVIRYVAGLSPVSMSILATHPDADHYGGFRYLLEARGAERCFLPAMAGTDGEYLAFLEAVARSGAETDTLTRYRTLTDSGAFLACLSPCLGSDEDDNDSSTVLYLEYEGVRAVLCGDISSAKEEKLVEEYRIDHGVFDLPGREVRPKDIDILKAAHHGSGTSSARAWLDLLYPSVFIVSAGRDNEYGLPAMETLQRYREIVPRGEIYRTDELGDIVVSIKDGKYEISANGV